MDGSPAIPVVYVGNLKTLTKLCTKLAGSARSLGSSRNNNEPVCIAGFMNLPRSLWLIYDRRS